MQKQRVLVWYLLLFSIAWSNVQLAMTDAISVATQEIAIMNRTGGPKNWAPSATATNAFPMYLDGISGISYWDCKVTANGADAGYVIVNANQTDIIIPECCPTGKTVTEKFKALVPGKTLTIYRYDVSKYLVLDAATKNVVALEGFAVSDQQGWGMYKLNNTHVESDFPDAVSFRSGVLSLGCFPSYTQSQLASMYADQSLHKTAITAGQSVFLQHSVASGTTLYYTPRWSQTTVAGNHAVGCGNTAWAIVYGYWERFKGKSALFGGQYLDNDIWDVPGYGITISSVAACMSECFGYNNSLGVVTGASMTLPCYMPNAIQYATNRGYVANTYCTRRNDDLNTNFNNILNEISNDRPVILYIATTDLAALTIADHYVVVEGAGLTGGGAYLQIIGGLIYGPVQQYWVNYGWGEDSKWITNSSGWCRDYFSINIGDPSSLSFYANITRGKPPLTVNFTMVKIGAPAQALKWDFGDGILNTSQQNPSHVYTKPGHYTVTLSAADQIGGGWGYTYSIPNYINVSNDITPVTQMLLQ